MVNAATKKFREPIAFGLLAVSALWFIGALSLLFKDHDFGLPVESGFAVRSALVGGLFESPITVISLASAVLLVTGLGGYTRNARVIVLIAMGIGGLNLIFGIITFFAKYGSDEAFGYSGIGPAGKVVGTLTGLAGLLFLGAALGYIFSAFQSLPAAVAQPAWGPPGQPGHGIGQSGWGQPGQGYGRQPQGGWGQPQSPQGWGAPGSTPAGGAAGWGGQPGPTAGWQPGSAQNWGAPAAQGWGDANAQSWQQSQAGWGQPAGQPGWGQPAGHPGGPTGQQPGYPGGPTGQQGPGSRPDWQWAHERPPAPTTWIQPSPTYGDGAPSQGDGSADPSWSQEEYGATGNEAGWSEPGGAISTQEEAFGGDDMSAPPEDDPERMAAVEDEPGAESSEDSGISTSPEADGPPSDGGWWQPSQR